MLATTLKALADPARLRLLSIVAASEGAEACVCDLIEPIGLSQPTVSKHLKVLREAELVSVREEGQHRYYSLSPEPLDEVDDWIVPFLAADEDVAALTTASSLPDSAAHAADVVGRAAASAKHALENALRKLPGR
ncbi:MAG: helix-turn-helix transcriptional regulator [Microbacterium sp.]|nr:helix-turn-helix transcriptional regulator [Microbacterium sp.]